MKHEFEQLAKMIGDREDMRPFAVTQKECALFIEEVGSDQPVPTLGTIVEIMGVQCMVVKQIAHPNWTPDDVRKLQ